MNSDTTTTIIGFIVAAGTAAQGYMSAPAGSEFGSAQFWIGMATAVGVACWGYWTNKHPQTPPVK